MTIAHDHHSHSHAAGGHAHGHGHSHAPANYDTAFAIGIALNLAFVVVEAVFGVSAHSLSLVADAGHNLSDVLGLGLAWGAAILARQLPTARRTYGLRRSSILAALANAVILLIAVGGIMVEAIGRFRNPGPVATNEVMVVAAIGIGINAATALLFLSGRKGDLNIRGAFMHMVADAGVSAGVVMSAFAIAATGWLWLDPVVSLAIAIIIVLGTWGLLRDSANLALDAVPSSVDPHAVATYLGQLDGVTELHDLHIWGMSTTDVALTVHLVVPGVADTDHLVHHACQALHDRFGVAHATIQVERGNSAHQCGLASPEVV